LSIWNSFDARGAEQTRPPPASQREHDLVPLLPRLDDPPQVLRVVLEIGIHQDDRVARGVVDPCRQRGVLAEVPRQAERDDPRVLGAQLREPFEGEVRAAVVDEDELEVERQRVAEGRQLPVQGLEDRLFVEDRDDDRDFFPGHRPTFSVGRPLTTAAGGGRVLGKKSLQTRRASASAQRGR
jgi:hypothetical protein